LIGSVVLSAQIGRLVSANAPKSSAARRNEILFMGIGDEITRVLIWGFDRSENEQPVCQGCDANSRPARSRYATALRAGR
jgi:hypothetical protein